MILFTLGRVTGVANFFVCVFVCLFCFVFCFIIIIIPTGISPKPLFPFAAFLAYICFLTSVARLSCYEGKEFELQCGSLVLAYDKLYAKNSGARATRRNKRILGNVKFVSLKDICLHSFCKVQAALVTIAWEEILAFWALNV